MDSWAQRKGRLTLFYLVSQIFLAVCVCLFLKVSKCVVGWIACVQGNQLFMVQWVVEVLITDLKKQKQKNK